MIYPGADWNPGVNAGYAAGRNQMRLCVAHFTVGVDSTPVGLAGYFHFLVSRGGHVQQFAELDALCWHAGQANKYGPGIEVEYLPGVDAEVFTGPQRAACGLLVEWVHQQDIPKTYYDGPRVDPALTTGFISHRSILQTDPHTDWWPQADWDAMVVPPTQETGMLYTIDQASFYAYEPHVGFIPATTYTGVGWLQIDQATYDRMNLAAQQVPGVPGTGTGASPEQVRAIVSEELAKLKLSTI